MKTITVRYFAMFREQAGVDEERMPAIADEPGVDGAAVEREGEAREAGGGGDGRAVGRGSGEGGWIKAEDGGDLAGGVRVEPPTAQ